MAASRVLSIPNPRVESEEKTGGKAAHGREGAWRAQRSLGLEAVPSLVSRASPLTGNSEH